MRFIRTAEVMDLCGLKHRNFWLAIEKGEFPPPDAYLGPRRPVWTDETVERWQRDRLENYRRPAPKKLCRRMGMVEPKKASA